MKLKKAKILLDKINSLFGGISDNPGKASAMERDLMLNYLRDLYDLVLEGDKPESVDSATLQYQALLKEKEESLREMEKARAEAENKAKAERRLREEVESKARKDLERQKMLEEAARNAAKEKEEEEKAKREAIEREIHKAAELKIAEDARRKAEVEARLKIEEELKLKAAKEAAAKEVPIIQNKPPVEETIPPSKKGPGFDEDLEELFEKEETMDLSQKISLRPIKNIKKAISINDRLLYINELYNKDASVMEQTVNTLNELENFVQARLYLEQKVINQFNWLAKKRKRRAKEFIDVVRRRFL